MNTFFITELLNVTLMGVDPPTGWLQDHNAFETKQECEALIPEITPIIYQQYMMYTHGLGTIDAIECMTEEDWIERNVELGHQRPERVGNKRKDTN